MFLKRYDSQGNGNRNEPLEIIRIVSFCLFCSTEDFHMLGKCSTAWAKPPMCYCYFLDKLVVLCFFPLQLPWDVSWNTYKRNIMIAKFASKLHMSWKWVGKGDIRLSMSWQLGDGYMDELIRPLGLLLNIFENVYGKKLLHFYLIYFQLWNQNTKYSWSLSDSPHIFWHILSLQIYRCPISKQFLWGVSTWPFLRSIYLEVECWQ
jgi:hypothetical protein